MNLNLKTLRLPKLPVQKLLKLLPIGTMLVLLGLLCWCMSFLYNYFYLTVANLKVVRTLQNQVALGQINLPLYQEVLSDLQKKKTFNAGTVDALRDPFSSPPPAVAAPTPEPQP